MRLQGISVKATGATILAVAFLFLLSFSFAHATILYTQPTINTVQNYTTSGGSTVQFVQTLGSGLSGTVGFITVNFRKATAGTPGYGVDTIFIDCGVGGSCNLNGGGGSYDGYYQSYNSSGIYEPGGSTTLTTIGQDFVSDFRYAHGAGGFSSATTTIVLDPTHNYAIAFNPIGVDGGGGYQFSTGGTSANSYSNGACFTYPSGGAGTACTSIADLYFIIYDSNGNVSTSTVVAAPLTPFNPFVWTPLGSSTLSDTFSNALTDIADINESNATTSATAGLQSFYNVPSYFANRVPFGYIYDIYNIWNNVSTSTTEFGSLSIDFDSLDLPTSTRAFLPGEVVFFSTSTVTSYVDDSLLDLLNALASAAIAVTFSLSLFRRATTVIKPV